MCMSLVVLFASDIITLTVLFDLMCIPLFVLFVFDMHPPPYIAPTLKHNKRRGSSTRGLWLIRLQSMEHQRQGN